MRAHLALGGLAKARRPRPFMVVVGAYGESDMRQPGLVLFVCKGVIEDHIRRGGGKGGRQKGWYGTRGEEASETPKSKRAKQTEKRKLASKFEEEVRGEMRGMGDGVGERDELGL